MTIGRSFPIRPGDRTIAFDPMNPGDTDRTAPLPFQVGVGAATDVDLTLPFSITYQSSIEIAGEGGGGTGFGAEGECNPITNQFCVPTATIVRASYPTAYIRCAIT